MLERFLVTELFAFLLVFCRLGAAIMLLPGFGESYVSMRARLLLAVTITILITPITQSYMPAVPSSPLSLGVLIGTEITIGVFIGMLSRILLSAMHTAGMLIAFQSGLSAALMFDPNAGTQGSPFGTLLSLAAIMLIFALDLHHVMLSAVADSYSLFPAGQFIPIGDFVMMATQVVSSGFTIAFLFAAPHIVIGMMVYLGSGILARLMPNMQVFFVIMPLQITVSFIILALSISSALLVYMSYFENSLTSFLLPR